MGGDHVTWLERGTFNRMVLVESSFGRLSPSLMHNMCILAVLGLLFELGHEEGDGNLFQGLTLDRI